MGRFNGKPSKGIKLARVKIKSYERKRKCFFSPRPSPCPKKYKTLTPKCNRSVISQLKRPNSELKRTLLINSDHVQYSPMKTSPTKIATCQIKTPNIIDIHQDILNDLGCSVLEEETVFKMPEEIISDLEKAEQNTITESRDVTERLIALIPDVVDELEKSGCLGDIETFFKLVKEKKFPLSNISFRLWCDVVKWFSCADTRGMRYSDTCLEFYWIGKRLFGWKFLRFMSGLKNETELLNGADAFTPETSRINFACPDFKVLQQYCPLRNSLPDSFKPGIMEELVAYKAERSSDAESFVLMLDGKKMKRGTDVDLLGCENGETLKERLLEKESQESVVTSAITYICEIQDETNIVKDTQKGRIQDTLITLIGLLMMFSNVLRQLRRLKRGKEFALQKLKDQGGKEWKKSKFAFAIDLYSTTVFKIRNCIDKTLKILRSICKTGAFLNGVGHLFADKDYIDLRHQENLYLLKNIEQLPRNRDESDTSIVKQRSEKWMSDRQKMKVTGSTMFDALGFDSLKRQKEHYERVVKGKMPKDPDENQKKAMLHGTSSEIHQLATMSGIVLPFLFPNLNFHEEGYYIKDNLLVSPDGSIRTSDNTVSYASEGKAPMEKTQTSTLHEEVPVRYIPQTILESRALGAESTLYLCWTDSSCTLFKVPSNNTLCQEMDQEVQDIYFGESIKCPSRRSQKSKDIKEDLIKHAKDSVFLGEFPSVRGYLSTEDNGGSDDTSSPYQRHIPKRTEDIDYTYDYLQRHLILGQEVVKEAYELRRIMATQVVVYLLADLDRFWKEELPHALPVMFFYRGYSLSMDIARRMTEKCKESLRSHGLDVVVTAADGEFNQLMVRGKDNQPLTQHQLMKDIWKDTCSLSKSQILDMFAEKCKPGNPVHEFINEKHVICIQTEDCKLHNIKTPNKGWKISTQNDKGTNEAEHEEEMTVEHCNFNEDSHRLDSIDELPDILQLADNQDEENEAANETSPTEKVEINVSEVRNILTKVNNDKWSNVNLDDISEYLQCSSKLNKLTVKELTELTKYVNEVKKDNSNRLKTSNVRKHILVNYLSHLIGDGSAIEARKAPKKRTVQSLRSLATRVITKRTYPKKVINVAYANYMWPDALAKWKKNARVSSSVQIKGLNRELNAYYVPDRTESGDFEVFVYDKTHLGSNLRKCVCLDKVHGISKEAWDRVACNFPEILHPLVVEVSEDGKIQDQMKEKYARNMYTVEVEECMRKNGDLIEASFCEVIREGLYEAEDTPGIPAIDRCEKRLSLIDWLDTGVQFGDFPPYGATIKGLSSILYEGLRSSTEAKIYLYALAKKGTYSARAPNTLCSESFFSTMQEMDPWGQGVLTSDGIEKHISDFTTITALKMKDERSFFVNTKKDKKYPVPKVSEMQKDATDKNDRIVCNCRQNRFIQCIVPRDHFFDSQARKRGKKRSQKPVKFSGINQALRGDQPIRARYGYKVNEAKVLTSKRIGLKFD